MPTELEFSSAGGLYATLNSIQAYVDAADWHEAKDWRLALGIKARCQMAASLERENWDAFISEVRRLAVSIDSRNTNACRISISELRRILGGIAPEPE
jgi:hypothetical protein